METETTDQEMTDIDRMVQAAVDEGTTSLLGGDDPDKVDPSEAEISDAARKTRWMLRRPSIDHLEPASVTTELEGEITTLPLFDLGDRIVIDSCTPHLKGSPWLETIVGTVKSIDDDTGDISVFDEATDQRCPTVRWANIRNELQVIRLAPAKGDPFDTALATRVVKPVLQPGQVKRGRGRPPGVKNRPKEVIKAEKEARKTARAARR